MYEMAMAIIKLKPKIKGFKILRIEWSKCIIKNKEIKGAIL